MILVLFEAESFCSSGNVSDLYSRNVRSEGRNTDYHEVFFAGFLSPSTPMTFKFSSD
jgi:hypothetical protein